MTYLETAELRLLGDAEDGDLPLLASRVQGGAAMGPGHTSSESVSRVQYSTALSAIKAYNGYQPRQKVLQPPI